MKRALVAVVTGTLVLVSGGGLGVETATASPVTGTRAAATAARVAVAVTPATPTSARPATPVRPATKNKFKNCTAMHKVFKHGVGRKGAKDKVRGKTKPVTTFKVSTKIYKLNKKMDRDKDGVACEKK